MNFVHGDFLRGPQVSFLGSLPSFVHMFMYKLSAERIRSFYQSGPQWTCDFKTKQNLGRYELSQRTWLSYRQSVVNLGKHFSKEIISLHMNY